MVGNQLTLLMSLIKQTEPHRETLEAIVIELMISCPASRSPNAPASSHYFNKVTIATCSSWADVIL